MRCSFRLQPEQIEMAFAPQNLGPSIPHVTAVRDDAFRNFPTIILELYQSIIQLTEGTTISPMSRVPRRCDKAKY
jgi:hypothetical protein